MQKLEVTIVNINDCPPYISRFICLMMQNDHYQLIDGPTHIHERGETRAFVNLFYRGEAPPDTSDIEQLTANA